MDQTMRVWIEGMQKGEKRASSYAYGLGHMRIVLHSNHYKYWKDKFACVRGREDSFGVLVDDGTPLFPVS